VTLDEPATTAATDDTTTSRVTGPQRGAALAEHAFDVVYSRRLLLVVMLAVMGFGSLMTIVTISLSAIAEDLDSSRATLGWIITGLMLAMAVTTPLFGKLGDIHGHRTIFLWGLLAGVFTTALCGVAWDAASLIGARVLFGVSGAMVMPNGMSLMMHAYGPRRRATAMGWFQFAMTGAPTIGLVVGGPLIDVVGWRNIFFAFTGVAVIALAVGMSVVRPTPRHQGTTLDLMGAVTLGAAVLGGLLFVTRATETARGGGGAVSLLTDLPTIGWLALAVVGTVTFVRVERAAATPMLELRYFRRRNFTAPMVASALMQFAYMGGFVVIPILLNDVYGWAIGATALILAPRPGAFSISSPVGGYLASRVGDRPPIVAGAVAMVISMIAFAAASDGGAVALIVVGLVLSGVSAGISQPGVASMVAGAVDPDDLGIANGMSQQMMFVGIVSGIQVMLVALGNDPAVGDFVRTFALGGIVASAGLVAALMTSNSRAPSEAAAH